MNQGSRDQVSGIRQQCVTPAAKCSHEYDDKDIVAFGCSPKNHISQPETEVRQIRLTQEPWSDESQGGK